MAQPHCPECKVTGLDNIVSSPSKEASKNGDAWFHISHCSLCGHVYGVFTKRITVLQTEAFTEYLGKVALLATGKDE